MTELGGMQQSGGLTLPAYTGAVTAAAMTKQLGMKYKTDNPMPGDFAMYSDRHVEIVEKVADGKVLSTIGGNTSDAVIRVTAPQGITHFITPPDKAGASSYNTIAQPSSSRQVEKIEQRYRVRAGAVKGGEEGAGRASGSLLSAPAFATIRLPIAVAAIKQQKGGLTQLPAADRKLLSKAVSGGQQGAIEQLYETLDNKANIKVNRIFRLAGDELTVLTTTTDGTIMPAYMTLWSADNSNLFLSKLAAGKLLDKKSTAALLKLMKQAPKSQSWGTRGPRVSGWGRDNGRLLLRQSWLQGKSALTTIVAGRSYKQTARASLAIASWLR